MGSGERAASILIQAAPLYGIPVWIGRIAAIQSGPHADYDDLPTIFTSGLYLLGAGLIVALVAALLSSRSPRVQTQAVESVRFHAWTALACAVLAGVLLLVPLADRGSPTLANPPRAFMTAATIAGFAYGLVLPLVELGRAISSTIRAARG